MTFNEGGIGRVQLYASAATIPPAQSVPGVRGARASATAAPRPRGQHTPYHDTRALRLQAATPAGCAAATARPAHRSGPCQHPPHGGPRGASTAVRARTDAAQLVLAQVRDGLLAPSARRRRGGRCRHCGTRGAAGNAGYARLVPTTYGATTCSDRDGALLLDTYTPREGRGELFRGRRVPPAVPAVEPARNVVAYRARVVCARPRPRAHPRRSNLRSGREAS